MHLGIYKMWFYTRCKFQTYTPWKSFEFKTLIGEILNNFVLHFSVWEDLWPYCNAYVRPGTRARIYWLNSCLLSNVHNTATVKFGLNEVYISALSNKIIERQTSVKIVHPGAPAPVFVYTVGMDEILHYRSIHADLVQYN